MLPGIAADHQSWHPYQEKPAWVLAIADPQVWKKKKKDKKERKDHYTALGNSAKNEKTEAM